ncbi:hypothetical protein tpqmel_0934, partial [Candidatus Gastranaerophilus sp. (ex Termes propinquus)]
MGAIAVSRSVNAETGERNNGNSLRIGGEYSEKKYSLRAQLYQDSPTFYLAGSDGAFNSDRMGINLGGSYRHEHFNLSGSFNRYSSNFKNIGDAGLTTFDSVSLNGSGRIPKIKTDVKFSSNAKKGQNNIGENSNYYYDLGFSRTFFDKLKL